MQNLKKKIKNKQNKNKEENNKINKLCSNINALKKGCNRTKSIKNSLEEAIEQLNTEPMFKKTKKFSFSNFREFNKNYKKYNDNEEDRKQILAYLSERFAESKSTLEECMFYLVAREEIELEDAKEIYKNTKNSKKIKKKIFRLINENRKVRNKINKDIRKYANNNENYNRFERKYIKNNNSLYNLVSKIKKDLHK